MRRLRIAVLCFFALLMVPTMAGAASKIALVIGNDNYQNIPKLLKAVNDANAMAKRLEEVGFKVILGIDLDRRAMVDKLQEFYLNIRTGDEVVIFYAGHGVEINDQNYLLPVDMRMVKPGHIFTVTKEAFSAQDFIDIARERVAQVTILILDACRNNPFDAGGTRSLVGASRGLAPVKGPEGTFVMYSAGAGQVALDRLNDADTNPNSVFTRKLLPLLKKPGMALTDIARTVRREVYSLAQSVHRQQRPAYYDEVLGDYYFREAESSRHSGEWSGGPHHSISANSVASEAERTNKAAEERLFWQSIENSRSTAPFKVYLSVYPKGAFKAEAEKKIAALKAAGATGGSQGAGGDRDVGGSGTSGEPATGDGTRGISVPSASSVPARGDRPAAPRTPALGDRPIARGTLRLPTGPRRVVFPRSFAEWLKEGVVSKLTCLKLWLARNEIYHRHGYCFRTRLGIQYFGNANCKTARTDILTPIEKRNVDLIRKWETEKKCK